MPNDTKKRFGILKAVLIILALLVAVVIALPFIFDVNQFRPQIESRLSSELGREVKVGNLKLSLLSGGIEADDILIADDPAFSRSPFVTSKSLRIGIELKQLVFSKEVRISGLFLDQPAIALIHSSAGRWNFSDLAGRKGSTGKTAGDTSHPSPETDILVKQLRITNGRISLVEGGRKPAVYKDVDITAENLSYTSTFPFSISASLPGGGTLKVEGNAGPLDRTDALRTPLTASLSVRSFDFVDSGFVPRDSGFSGLLNFNGTMTSDGSSARSKGHAEVDKLQVAKGGEPAARAVSMDYSLDYDLANERGTLHDGEVRCGTALAHLNGDYSEQGDNLNLRMALRGSDMPLKELVELLPAFGVALPKEASLEGGTLNVDLTAEGPVSRLVTKGTVSISNTRLAGYDLAGKLAQLATSAGLQSNNMTEIEKFSSAVQITPEGTYLNNLVLVVPVLGELSGEGKVATDHSLDFTMNAKLKPSGALGSALSRLVTGGTLNIPFLVRGTASEPKFVPNFRNAATGLLGSETSGRGSQEGQADSGESLGNVLRDLFKKKKQ